MFFVIDRWVLNRLEFLTQWFEQYTGFNCFWWARQSPWLCIIYATLCAVFIGWYQLPKMYYLLSIDLIPPIIVAALLLERQEIVKIINDAEEEVKALQLKGLANPVQIRSDVRLSQFIDILFVMITISIFSTITVTFLGLLWQSASNFFTSTSFPMVLYLSLLSTTPLLWGIAVLYLLSCNLKPRAKSKIKQWLETAKRFLKESIILVPHAQPVPVRIPSH